VHRPGKGCCVSSLHSETVATHWTPLQSPPTPMADSVALPPRGVSRSVCVVLSPGGVSRSHVQKNLGWIHAVHPHVTTPMWSDTTDAKGEMAHEIRNRRVTRRWELGVGVVVGLLVLCLGVWLMVSGNPIGIIVATASPIVAALAGLLAYAISDRLLYQGVRKQKTPIPTTA